MPIQSTTEVASAGGFLRISRRFRGYALIPLLSFAGLFTATSTSHARNEALEKIKIYALSEDPRVRAYAMVASPNPHQVDELIGLAQQILRTRDSTGQALLVIYALYQQLEHPRRKEILQILRDLAEPETKGETGHKKSKLASHDAFSTNRIRMTALLALVQSGDKSSLAYVLAMAFSPIDEDPWGREAARKALHRHPRLKEALSELEPLLSREEIDQLLNPVDAPPTNLLDVVRKAAQDATGYSRAVSLLARQLKNSEGPGLSRDTWTKALKANALWTLRTTSLLYATMPADVLAAARRTAQRHESDSNDLGRAARFFSAIDESPDHTAAHPGSMSKTSASLRPARQAPSMRQHWDNYRKNGSLEAVSHLCSSFDGATGQGAPSFKTTVGRSQLLSWLEDPLPQRRAACIWGVSQSLPPSMLPYLISAYLNENEPGVRSALTYALSRYLAPVHPLLRTTASLDGDPFVRQFAGAATPEEGLGFVLSMRTPCGWVSTRRGRGLLPHAADDGFCAAVAPDL